MREITRSYTLGSTYRDAGHQSISGNTTCWTLQEFFNYKVVPKLREPTRGGGDTTFKIRTIYVNTKVTLIAINI